MDETLLKVSCNGRNYHLIVAYPEKAPHSLKITFLDGTEVWCGEVSQEDLEKQAEAIDKSFQEFWSNTKKALSSDVNQNHFCYEVKSTKSHREFSWKQSLKHGIKFQLGSARLFRSQENDLASFLDVAVEQFTKMKNEISRLTANNKTLISDQERSLKKLDECVTAKNGMEKDLFQKFTAVLNAKKSKIRELKQQRKDIVTQSQNYESNNVRKLEESNDEDENTDDEKEREGKLAEKAKKRRPAILDEEASGDEENGPLVVKRKAANRRKRNTPASILPRTTSLPRPIKQDSTNKPNVSSQRQTATPTESPSDLDKLMDEL